MNISLINRANIPYTRAIPLHVIIRELEKLKHSNPHWGDGVIQVECYIIYVHT